MDGELELDPEGHEIMELEIGGEEVLNEDLDDGVNDEDEVSGGNALTGDLNNEEDSQDEELEDMEEAAGDNNAMPSLDAGMEVEGMQNRGSARKGAVSTGPNRTQVAQAELIAGGKAGTAAGVLVNGHNGIAGSPAEAPVELVMESMPSLAVVDEEPTRFVVLNDTRNLAPFATCLCSAKPVVSSLSSDQQQQQSNNNTSRTIFCQAIDCVDGKMIGCCNQAKLTLLFRSSKRVPYRIYCEVHLARLRRHHCCPGCGLFCTQGEFLQCFSVKKQVHLFHKNCQVVSPGTMGKQHCPHCASISDLRSVPIAMNGPVANNTVYYLLQTPLTVTPKARITGPNNKTPGSDKTTITTVVNGKENVCETATPRAPTPDPVDEPGDTVLTIPESQKVLSVAGLPLGPNREMLQAILSTVGAEKKSPIRLTPNKNFYNVARIGETDKVVALLMQGFDPNYAFEDHENETPLHAAAQAGHVDIVHLLMQAGADPNVLNARLNTPLMTAIEGKQNDVVQYLIRSGAAVEFRGEDGMTALHLASKSGNKDAVKLLLDAKKKLDVNLQDDGGWTALIWATEHKQTEIIELLLDRGADANIQDDEENTCLHWAAFAGDADILSRFLDIGCDVNAVNAHGDTACHIAARRDHESCVLVLTSRGADVGLVNVSGETALTCCPNSSSSSQTYAILKVKSELMEAAKKRKVVSDRLLHRDIAKGREKYAIPIVNRVDDSLPPTDYTYVKENCETTSACTHMDRTITSLQCCQCEDDCGNSDCICGTISFRVWYDRDGRLDESFNFNDPPMIFECNRGCACWISTCSNRVVQKGLQTRLQVFRTQSMGWGVRALAAIPKGTFVCEYVGEIISDTDADRRHDDSYLFDLDHRVSCPDFC